MASFTRAIRPLIAVGRVAFPRHAAASVRMPAFVAARSFAVSVAKRGHGSADVDLSKLLQKEIEHERAEYKEDDKFIDKFVAKTEWLIDAKPNSSEVTMSKTFGNEKIHVRFSISDINNTSEEFDPEMDEENSSEEDDDTSYTVHAVVSCEKPDKGVLTFETEIADGSVNIVSVVHYPTAALALGTDNESDWQRSGLYGGPSFAHLEEDLQTQFYEYLEERGINTGLAVFVPQLIESLEQKEYVDWLGKVKEFVHA